MGFDIQNSVGDEFSCSNMFWFNILEIAEANGWEPKGTTLWDDDNNKEDEDWDGTYATNDGQCMSTEDMENMLNALKKARKEGVTKDWQGNAIKDWEGSTWMSWIEKLIKFFDEDKDRSGFYLY